jgi:hypothetical protein
MKGVRWVVVGVWELRGEEGHLQCGQEKDVSFIYCVRMFP